MEKPNSLPRDAEFASCLREIQTRLYGYIHSLARDLNDADDLFQQTALILWKKFEEYDRERSFFSWACGIARLEVVNFLRSRARRRRRDALAKCVAKLRERDQELLLECYQETGGVNEAAARRGRSSQSIFNSLRRIRRALYVCISRTMSQESRLECFS